MLLLVTVLLLVSCGGGGGGGTVAIHAAPATLPPTEVVSCPSGVIGSQGGGAEYLNLRGSYERAVDGAISDGRPRLLGHAAAAIPTDLMVGLEYTGCTSLGGPSNFEEMAWSNGIGLLLVAWHEWPKVADPTTAPFGGTASQAGVVTVWQMETGTEDSRMRVVRLFDGLKIVSVSTYGLTTMSIEQVEEVAWAVYDGLPINMKGAEATGATVAEVLGSVRSDQVTVGEAVALHDVSSFTSRTGAAHTSYSAVIDGTGVVLYDFGVPEVAERAASMISPDGYSLAHQPYDWASQPHFWQVGRVILLYQGGSSSFVEFLAEQFGPPVAGGVIE